MVLEPKGIKGTQGYFYDKPNLSVSCFVWDGRGADQRENCPDRLKFLLQLFSTVLVLNGQMNHLLQCSGVRQSHFRHFQLGLQRKLGLFSSLTSSSTLPRTTPFNPGPISVRHGKETLSVGLPQRIPL